jgi:hypothetical protein
VISAISVVQNESMLDEIASEPDLH